MKKQVLLVQHYFAIVWTVILCGSLLNQGIFGPVTLSALFIPAIAVGVTASLVFICSKSATQLVTSKRVLGNSRVCAVSLLVIYYWVNALYHGQITIRHYYISVIGLLFFVCLCSALYTPNSNWLWRPVKILACLQAMICLLQQLNYLPTADAAFQVTGTCVNPNNTAMFLTLCLPVLYVSLKGAIKPLQHTKYVTAIVLIVLALCCLKCRTAFLGIFCMAVIQLCLQSTISGARKKYLLVGWIVVVGGILLTGLYFLNVQSAEGRLLVWKIVLRSIGQQTWWGGGYGLFEHDYNLAQANYFAEAARPITEIFQAGYIHMSYNELLENIAEGGLLGGAVWVVFLIAWLPRKLLFNQQQYRINSTEEAVFCLAMPCFIIMSLVNFTFQAIPVMLLTTAYAGVFVGKQAMPQDALDHAKVAGLWVKQTVTSALAIGFTAIMFVTATSYAQCKALKTNSNAIEAAQQILPLEKWMFHSVFYWRSRAAIAERGGNISLAIDCYNKARQLSSDPDIYTKQAKLYAQKGDYPQAIQLMQVSKNMQPHLFAPCMALMHLYNANKDTASSLAMAQYIVQMPVKVPSKKVDGYKQAARDWLISTNN